MTDRIIAIGDVHGCAKVLATDQVKRHYGEAVVGHKKTPRSPSGERGQLM